MPVLPSTQHYITSEETEFEAPVAESAEQRIGEAINFLNDQLGSFSQTFDADGNFTGPAGVDNVLLLGRGGSGGGGGGGNNIAGASSNGGGGGQGVPLIAIRAKVVPLTVYPVVIGPGGAGGDGTNISTTANGGDGGTGAPSSFGNIYFRNVGAGGKKGFAAGTAGSLGGLGGLFNLFGGNGGDGGTPAQAGFTGLGSVFALLGAIGGVRNGNNGGGGGGGAGDVTPTGIAGLGGRSGQAFAITSAVRASNLVTITTSVIHPFVIGQRVHIANVSDASFNSASQILVSGGFIVTAITPTTFQYIQVAADASSSGGLASPTNGFDGLDGCGGGGGGGAQNTGHRGGCGGKGSPGRIIVMW